MKTANSFIILFFFILLGCTKETSVESELARLKAAKVPFPFELNISAKPDYTVPQVACLPIETKVSLPGKQWLSGNVDYIDKINTNISTVENTGCEILDIAHLKQYFKGTVGSENGDLMYFTGWIEVDVSNAFTTQTAPIKGTLLISGGTGDFDGIQGSIVLSGTSSLKNGVVSWDGNGHLAYK